MVHHFKVGETEGYINVGFFEDGSPGEVFITMSREGSTIGGMMDSLAAMCSIALQHGTPLEALIHKFAFQSFEPKGHTRNSQIPYAHSIVDYVFRWMGYTFIPNYDETKDTAIQPITAQANKCAGNPK